MYTPRCTTLSARPCYYCWKHSGNHRWIRTLPIGPPRSTSRNWFSSSLALGSDVAADIIDGHPLTCLAYMIVQDVAALPTLTTWWAHNPQFHRIETWLSGTPISPKLFLTIGFVWRSPTTFLETIYSGTRRNTYSRLLWAPFTPCFRHRTVACSLETSHETSLLCSRYFLKFQFESYFLPPSSMISTR